MSEQQAVLANIAFGVVAVIGGIIALRNMDRIDRRKTFMIGLTLTTTFHCLVGIASMLLPAGNPARPYVILVLVVGFVLSMQTFLNVAVWVWLAEVFPLHMRGLGIGMAVFFCWVTNGIPRALLPDPGRDHRHHRVVLPVRRDRSGRVAVRVHPGARNPRPLAGGARRRRGVRADLRRPALSRPTDDGRAPRTRRRRSWADFSPGSSCSVRSTPHSWRRSRPQRRSASSPPATWWSTRSRHRPPRSTWCSPAKSISGTTRIR